MNPARLRPGEAVAGLSGAALLVVMFLDWYGVRGGGAGVSAWTAFSVTDVVLGLVALAGLALALLQATQRTPALPVATSVLAAALGIAATLLVAYRLLNAPGPDALVELRPGAWLGLLATAGVAAGAWLSTADDSAPGGGGPPVAVEHRPAPPPS
jgi:hypothetical protein